MKVTICVEDNYVEVEAEVPFSPDVLTDLCHRATTLYRDTIATLAVDSDKADDE